METRPLVCGFTKRIPPHMQSADVANSDRFSGSLSSVWSGKEVSPRVQELLQFIPSRPRFPGHVFGLFLLLTSWHFIRCSSSAARSARHAVSQLRAYVVNLSLNGKRTLAFYMLGSAAAAGKQAKVARDKRLCEIHAKALCQALSEEQEVCFPRLLSSRQHSSSPTLSQSGSTDKTLALHMAGSPVAAGTQVKVACDTRLGGGHANALGRALSKEHEVRLPRAQSARHLRQLHI